MKYLIPLSTITTGIFLGFLFKYLGWHGYSAGFITGGLITMYYYIVLRIWDDAAPEGAAE